MTKTTATHIRRIPVGHDRTSTTKIQKEISKNVASAKSILLHIISDEINREIGEVRQQQQPRQPRGEPRASWISVEEPVAGRHFGTRHPV